MDLITVKKGMRLKCRECEYVCSSKNKMAYHYRDLHRGKKFFDCVHCPSNFMDYNSLRRHIKAFHRDEEEGDPMDNYDYGLGLEGIVSSEDLPAPIPTKLPTSTFWSGSTFQADKFAFNQLKNGSNRANDTKFVTNYGTQIEAAFCWENFDKIKNASPKISSGINSPENCSPNSLVEIVKNYQKQNNFEKMDDLNLNVETMKEMEISLGVKMYETIFSTP